MKVKRSALRRTAGPGTAAAAAMGDGQRSPCRRREAEPASGRRSAELPGEGDGESPGGPGRRERARFCGRAMQGLPAGSALRRPGRRGSLPALPLPSPLPAEALGRE